MRRFVLLVLLTATACGGSSAESANTIRGTFTLDSGDVNDTRGGWSLCSGEGGYADFKAGMNVTVRDGEGSIIGTGSTRNLTTADLDDKTWGPTAELAESPKRRNTACTLVFEVPVKDAEFYTVSAGKRGELSFSREELASGGWWVDLTLGD